jgi:hypothetical protein
VLLLMTIMLPCRSIATRCHFQCSSCRPTDRYLYLAINESAESSKVTTMGFDLTDSDVVLCTLKTAEPIDSPVATTHLIVARAFFGWRGQLGRLSLVSIVGTSCTEGDVDGQTQTVQ